jgi:hypothetical protein
MDVSARPDLANAVENLRSPPSHAFARFGHLPPQDLQKDVALLHAPPYIGGVKFLHWWPF